MMSHFSARMVLTSWAVGCCFAWPGMGWAQATRSSGSIGTGSSVGTGSSIGTTGSLGGGSSVGGTGIGSGMGTGSSSGIGGTGTPGQAGSSIGTSTTVSTLSPTASGAASSNPIGAYFLNPLSAGKPGGTGKMTGMWTPLYTTTTTTTGITGNINTTSGTNMNQAGSILNRRGPAYTVAVTFPYEPATASQLRTEAQNVLARSNALTMKDSIKVRLDGQTLVLEGQVRSDQERRLAENMVRLTPGARSIQNNLQIVQTGPPPRQTP